MVKKFLKTLQRTKNEEPSNGYLIVGLGNPGRKYEHTRHNIGFKVLDAVAKKLDVEFSRMQSKAMITKVLINDSQVILAKPRTFMNLSGQSVAALTRFYKIELERLLLVFDDVDLPFETLRLRGEGGSSGHNGMKSILVTLSSQKFPRLRIGVGRPAGRMSTANFVTQKFSKSEEEVLPFIIQNASDAAISFIKEGLANTMNKFNKGTE